MNFALILFLLTALTGVIALADKVFFSRHRGRDATEPWWIEYAKSFFPVLLIVFLLRSFLAEPFKIPSSSMRPTLEVGDFILVNKFAYGLRLPIIEMKIVPIGEPKRGDVIVFRLPSDPSTNYIKRLVGLPGDHVQVRDNHVTINDMPMELTWTGFYTESPNYVGARLGIEKLGEKEHVVMAAAGRYSTDFEAVIPAGHYYFMGDNRNNSLDSRFPQVGFVPEENIVGRAVRIWMHWEWPKMPAWSRIGQAIE
jgi:signal peptidase I